MKDYGIRKNASNYYDETAYKALSVRPRPGEIWTHNSHSDHVLILASNERFSAILKLNDKWREGKVVIHIRGKTYCKIMYTDPMKINYLYHDLLGAYQETLHDCDFADVRKAVVRVLGLTKETKKND